MMLPIWSIQVFITLQVWVIGQISYLIDIYMRISCILILLAMMALTYQARYNQSLTQWTFRIEGGAKDYPASIPSSLAWDLIDNKIVSSDPYYRDNFLQFYEYETKDASYKTTFNIASNILNSKHQFLVFQGLDTHAEVYLNGQHILSAHNMFRRYQVPVKFNATNTIVVNFTASTKYDLQQERIFKETYGFGLPANYSFTRKAAYQYGWDWGPRILSVGIWKEVFAVVYNDSRLDNIRFTHSVINKTTKTINCQVSVDINHLDQLSPYSLTLQVKKKANGVPIHEQLLSIKSTTSTSLSIPFNITNNIWDFVWWTWDLGQSNLITVSMKLVNLNSLESFDSSINTGIRTVNVIQEYSKTYNGTSFTFNLNGYDVYMRGGNYIPPEMSLARTNKVTYEKVKNDALFGRYNMIRLWGGGQFQKNEFYDAMDEAGIMIWHDLMFACALYPSSAEILANIEGEMRDNIRRIRHHPSIGLWNGNNEVWIGWQEWGWKNGLSDLQKKQVQDMYGDVFRGVLPNVLKQEHPEVYYWETSPSASSSSTRTLASGDIHFWRVWAAGSPIEEYQEYVGRFNSEYGMQAIPEISTLQRFTKPEDLNYETSNDSYVMRLHERHPNGHVLLPGYTFNYSGATGNLSRISYFSQIMQSYALEMAVTSLRLNKPYNMGSLYWQLNDVWPVTSWSTVDYYGTYKAAHYKIRNAHQQLIIHTIHDKVNNEYSTYIVNDYNKTFSTHSNVSIITFAGEQTKVKHTFEKTIKPFDRVLLHKFNKTQFANFTNNGFIRMELRTLDNVISNNNYFFVPMRLRTNALPDLTYSIQGKSITISTKKIASYVWIYRKVNENYLPLKLEDNYFTLIPGETRTIDIGDTPHGQIYVTCYEIEFNAEKKKHLKEE